MSTSKPVEKEIWLRASCELSFEVVEPTAFVFMLRPRSIKNQWVAYEEFYLSESIQAKEYSDSYGNLCQRLVAPCGDFHIHTAAEVLVSLQEPPPFKAPYVNVKDLPDEVLHFLLPSRYCESDRFHEMAIEIVGDVSPGISQVEEITNWVRRNVKYTLDSSPYPVSAIEVNSKRVGVCRDLAHICIALCRSLCIPARMVVGYLYKLRPMDIHAWFEVYINGQWYTFDPTEQAMPEARITIAHGRDASDVAIYNQYGPMVIPNDMRVVVERSKRST